MPIWEYIGQHISQGKKLAFLYVIKSEGSSPGRKGFCMVVDKAGRMMGSIGGGMMEKKMVELARMKLKERNFVPFVKHQVHRKSGPNRSGMICSGEQTIAFYQLDSTHSTLAKRIVACIRRGEAGTLELTHRGMGFTSGRTTTRCLVSDPEETSPVSWSVTQAIGYKHKIFILGGGHVGLALSGVMRQLGFYVEIFDNRRGLNTMKSNMTAHKKHFVDYATIGQRIPEGNDTYVAIVSFGFRTDKDLVKSLIGRKYAYIGMMGSREKVKELFSEIQKEGAPAVWLKSVRSPIGLTIGSRTPEEIAISIASEIISVQSQKKPA